MPAVNPIIPNKQRVSKAASASQASPVMRVRVIYSLLLFLAAIFIVRLFYLQVIRHDHYRSLALESQLKQYEIPAKRGVIYARDGDKQTALVLNDKRYTLFADPTYIKDPLKSASLIAPIISGNVNNIRDQLLIKNTRYVVLAKKLTKEQSDKIAKLDLLGVGTREQEYRTYPQGTLASQLLGFVNDDGKGQYGVEEYLDDSLAGKPGELKAITDAQGVPLVSNRSNVITDPIPGEQLNLTIDINIQRQLEQLLKAGLERASSKSGSALIMNVKTGAVLAMANYPSYDPSKLQNIEDLSTLSNPISSDPLEVGSIMKPLTTAAAISEGVINKNTTYNDPARINVDGALITNVAADGGPAVRSIADFLKFSLNTGATYLLQQMGGGEINKKARDTWHSYMVDHFGFGSLTGIEQSGEQKGYVPDPDHGNGLNVIYANTSFGQGMSATMLQMAAAYAGVLNDGAYNQPHLVESTESSNGLVKKTDVKKVRQVVSPSVSHDVAELLEGVFTSNHVLYNMQNLPTAYRIGGKTGSAQVAKPEGGYYEDRFNGTFAGFVGGDQPEYVIVTRVNDPGIGGFAGAASAAPIFSSLATMMMNSYSLTPRSK